MSVQFQTKAPAPVVSAIFAQSQSLLHTSSYALWDLQPHQTNILPHMLPHFLPLWNYCWESAALAKSWELQCQATTSNVPKSGRLGSRGSLPLETLWMHSTGRATCSTSRLAAKHPHEHGDRWHLLLQQQQRWSFRPSMLMQVLLHVIYKNTQHLYNRWIL